MGTAFYPHFKYGRFDTIHERDKHPHTAQQEPRYAASLGSSRTANSERTLQRKRTACSE